MFPASATPWSRMCPVWGRAGALGSGGGLTRNVVCVLIFWCLYEDERPSRVRWAGKGWLGWGRMVELTVWLLAVMPVTIDGWCQIILCVDRAGKWAVCTSCLLAKSRLPTTNFTKEINLKLRLIDMRQQAVPRPPPLRICRQWRSFNCRITNKRSTGRVAHT